MTELANYSSKQRYRITLLVTAQQEFAIQGLFSLNGWPFSKVEELPDLIDITGGATTAECANDWSDLSSKDFILPSIEQPVQPANATESFAFPDSYTEIKKEIMDSETYSADEVNNETLTGDMIILPVSQGDTEDKLLETSVPNNEENTSSDTSDSYNKSKKSGEIEHFMDRVASEFLSKIAARSQKVVDELDVERPSVQKSDFLSKIAERSQKVVDELDVERPSVQKVHYEDGESEKNKLDNQIDEISLIIRKDDKLLCCMCRVSFPDEDKFKDHASVCLKSLFDLNESCVYKCRGCPAYFRQAYTLLRHRQFELCESGRERKAKILTCKHCKKTYSSLRRSEFIVHIQTHKNEFPFECEHCNQKFSRLQTLKNHKRLHTGEKPYKCRHCDLRFSSSAGQRSHEITRHTDRPRSFVCDKCGAAFMTSNNLKCHIREVHDIPVIYTCDFCSKQFSRKSSFQIHRKLHTNLKDKVCEICGKGFYRQADLTHHMKRHNNEHSHFCDTCGKGFYSKQKVDDHKRTHTGAKPYSCSLCNYQCAYYSNTIKHVRLKHPEITDMKTVICKNKVKNVEAT